MSRETTLTYVQRARIRGYLGKELNMKQIAQKVGARYDKVKRFVRAESRRGQTGSGQTRSGQTRSGQNAVYVFIMRPKNVVVRVIETEV